MAAFSTKKGINIASPFKLQAEELLDVRQKVDTIAERDELVTIHAAAPGLRVFVTANKTTYIYNGSGWDEVTKGAAYKHPTGDGNLHVPATGTGNNNKVLVAGSTAGSIAWKQITASMVSGIPTYTLKSFGVEATATEINRLKGLTTNVVDLENYATTNIDKLKDEKLSLTGGKMTGDISIPATPCKYDGGVPYAGSNGFLQSSLTEMSGFKTYFGAVCVGDNNTTAHWKEIISIRHHNNSDTAGFYIYTSYDADDGLTFRKQSGPNAWYNERVLLDSTNYSTYAATKGHGHSNATTSAAGFMPKLNGSTSNYLRGDGAWATPPNTNTDTKVTQTTVDSSGYTNWRTILWGASNSGTEGFSPTTMTSTAYVSANLSFQPSTGTLRSTKFKGALTGNADTATALTSSAGSTTQPVYFSDGKPVAIGYTIGKSVPSNAVFTDTTYSTFVKSGTGAKAGLVPAPSTTEGTTKYLREDGTWTVPPNTNTTYSNMKGATSSAAGTAGLVPAPAAGASNRYLRSDGTWQVPPDTNTTYTLSSFGISASAAELNYVKGVTSAIQTQLNNKSNNGHTHDLSTMINTLSEGTSTPTDADYYVSQYVGGGTTTTTYHRRPVSALAAYVKTKLAAVASSGSYNDLSNKPTIPSVGNGTVTITQAGSTKGTFTLNQSGNVTIALTDTNTNTTYSNMKGATTSAAGAAGLVPAPASGAANRYLRSDGTWQVPPDNNTTYSTMKGATTSAAGTAGLVPAPATGAANRYLRSDGTWQVPPDTNTNTWRGIQDNLTSSSTSDSLSANQGRVLKGLVDGKAASSHTHSSISTVGDNRSVATKPSDYSNKISFAGLKNSSTVNSPTSSTYVYVLGLKGWSDNSGGPAYEYAMGNGDIFYRTEADASSWNGWNKLLTTANAASASVGSASALTSSAGSTTQPVYFSGGKPVAIGYTISKSVPSNAVFTDTTYSTFVKSGSGAKAGLVPAPSTTAGTSKYLREDGTWQTPPNTNTTYSNMKGATTSAAGAAGLVPAPATGAANRYLRSDGTWAVPPDTNTTYSLASFGISASATELNYVKGVTSAIQTQLNGKAASSHSHSAATTSAAGFMPKLNGSTSNYLRGDGAWATPPNTNTDTKVTNTLGTTTKAYVTGTTSASTNTGTQVFDTGVYLTSAAGGFHADNVIEIGGAKLTYDSTNKALTISFS